MPLLSKVPRPAPKDAVIAACFLIVGQAVTWGRLDEPANFHGPRPVNAVLNLLVCAALLWRQRAPLAAVVTVAVVFCGTEPVFRHDVAALTSFVPLIVLTASAGYHSPRRDAVVAAAVATLGLLAVVLTEPSLRDPANFGYDAVFLLGPWLAGRGLREREDRAAALATVLARERAEQEAARQATVHAEQVRIARELHDVVAHSVSVMVIQLGAARTNLPPASTAGAPLLAAEEQGRQALAELRRMLGILRSSVITDETGATSPEAPQPGLGDLQRLVEATAATGVRVKVSRAGAVRPLPPGLDLSGYRIVQEALTNALKHSRPRDIVIHVRYASWSLEITVINDGLQPLPPHPPGHGLVGIRERAALFGGTAHAGPTPDQRWQVTARLPYPPAPSPDAPAGGGDRAPDAASDAPPKLEPGATRPVRS
jgi:signal transduction histidine kinase